MSVIITILLGLLCFFALGILAYWLVAEYEEYRYRQWCREHIDPRFDYYKGMGKK